MTSWLQTVPVLLAQGSGGAGLTFLIPMAIIGLFAYFFFIRPEKQKQAAHTELMSNLKKNDRVVTIGGILGTVVNVQKDAEEIVIRIDENSNAKIHVLRSAISRVVTPDAEKKDAKQDASK